MPQSLQYYDLTTSEDPAVAGLRDLFEENTELTLRRLYVYVADRLTAEFEELEAMAREQLGTLAKLADVDLSAHADVEAEINKMAGRVVYRSAARECVLGLFEAARTLAREPDSYQPCSVERWTHQYLNDLGDTSQSEFTEDTGLEGREIKRAARVTAQAIVDWPQLEASVPVYFRGTFVTIAAAEDGVILGNDPPIIFLANTEVADRTDPFEELFKKINVSSGVAEMASSPDHRLALVGARNGWFMPDRDNDVPGLIELALGRNSWVEFSLTEPVGASLTSKLGSFAPIKLSGSLRWDPRAVEVQSVGAAVLLKPKVGYRGLPWRSPEGVGRTFSDSKHLSFDLNDTSLVIDDQSI